MLFEIWAIDEVCSTKMARYWPSSFHACLWTDTESTPANRQKKNEASIKPSRVHYSEKSHFFLAEYTGQSPESIRPARVANHCACAGFGFILPAHTGGHIIMYVKLDYETNNINKAFLTACLMFSSKATNLLLLRFNKSALKFALITNWKLTGTVTSPENKHNTGNETRQ